MPFALALLVVAAVPLLSLTVAGSCDAGERDATIRRSDVVFMYDDPAQYEAYGCTVLGWAGRADARHIANAHAAGVRHFAVSVGFLTEFRGMIDFDERFLDATARNYDGEPFVVPWLTDHWYKEHPAYWWCTNSPLYREYLYSRLEQRMTTNPDGLHIDDYRGTSAAVPWRSACFCEHCMAGFRDHLASRYSEETLRELGIADLASFNYREFLQSRGVTSEEYRNRRERLPFAAEFLDYHVTANNAFIAEYRRRAEAIHGGPLSLCVNSGLSNPQALSIAPQLSYFCCEVPHHATRLQPARHPIFIYKLGDAVRRPVTSTASGEDWAFVKANGHSGLVRTWIALSYAFGHNFMAPHRQWCHTHELGTHWYSGPAEEYAPLYRFVRDQAASLDHYEAIAPVAVLYDMAAVRAGVSNPEPICLSLAEANIPFAIVMAGDGWLPEYQLTEETLAGFSVVVVPETTRLDAARQAVLDQAAGSGRVVSWQGIDALRESIGTFLVVDPADQVMVVPRRNTRDASAPIVLHVLNRAYDPDSEREIPQDNVRIRIHSSLLEDRPVTSATLIAFGVEPRQVDAAVEGEYVEIVLPTLELWTLVQLKFN